MSIQLRQCSTNHAYATLQCHVCLKDSYIIVLVVWKVDRCLTLYLERAFFRPCDLINQHAFVHLMKIWTSMNVIHVGCPFTKQDSLGKWYWHWSIDPTWLILRKKIDRVPSRFESTLTWGQRCSSQRASSFMGYVMRHVVWCRWPQGARRGFITMTWWRTTFLWMPFLFWDGCICSTAITTGDLAWW